MLLVVVVVVMLMLTLTLTLTLLSQSQSPTPSPSNPQYSQRAHFPKDLSQASPPPVQPRTYKGTPSRHPKVPPGER